MPLTSTYFSSSQLEQDVVRLQCGTPLTVADHQTAPSTTVARSNRTCQEVTKAFLTTMECGAKSTCTTELLCFCYYFLSSRIVTRLRNVGCNLVHSCGGTWCASPRCAANDITAVCQWWGSTQALNDSETDAWLEKREVCRHRSPTFRTHAEVAWHFHPASVERVDPQMQRHWRAWKNNAKVLARGQSKHTG
ncbi:hypothetical protein TRVL_07124 [Trypanosoma vivax]|nr:hypothetical protein TRVL_07124 [Trypanosoma vivax]